MKKARKLLSLVLCLVLVLGFFPAAYAEGEGEGTVAPAVEPDRGNEGSIAPSAEDPVGDGVPDVPSDDPSAPAGDDAPGAAENGSDTLPAADDPQTDTASGTCGKNLTWTLENGMLTISGTGEMTNWSNEAGIPWYSYAETITELVLPEGLTSIGSWAFLGLSGLTHVEIPASVTDIHYYAFLDCYGLTSVTIPSGVKSIGAAAFGHCTALTSIEIPASVTSIAWAAFSSCESLKTISFLGDAPSIDDAVFEAEFDAQPIRARALYPIDNPTWTADKLQNYGADELTWVGYRDVAAAYTVHFDPNGGSDAPADQIKGHGVDLTLSEAAPSREGYSFLGWATEPDATQPEYQPGDSFTQNNDIVLYAVWEPTSYTISYDANGGEGAPEAQTKTHDVPLTLTETVPTRVDGGQKILTVTLDPNGGSISANTLYAVGTERYHFDSWNTAADGSGTSYAPGAEYTANESTTLYAQWIGKASFQPVPLPTPEREGYRFKGWAEDPNASEGETGSYTPEDNVTLYAIWEIEAAGSLRVLAVSGKPGSEILVPLELSDNPGLAAIDFNLSYDKSVLEFVGVEDGSLSGWGQNLRRAYVFWEAADGGNQTAAGVIATLRFRIAEDAEEGTTLVSILNLEATDRDDRELHFNTEPGQVSIIGQLPGDVNGDGELDAADVTGLLRYVKYHEATEGAAPDVNGDGTVDNRDVTHLIRYIWYPDIGNP